MSERDGLYNPSPFPGEKLDYVDQYRPAPVRESVSSWGLSGNIPVLPNPVLCECGGTLVAHNEGRSCSDYRPRGERDAFEAWARHEEVGLGLGADANGEYYALNTDLAWASWQAASKHAETIAAGNVQRRQRDPRRSYGKWHK